MALEQGFVVRCGGFESADGLEMRFLFLLVADRRLGTEAVDPQAGMPASAIERVKFHITGTGAESGHGQSLALSSWAAAQVTIMSAV
jgi:hypothetical protein